MADDSAFTYKNMGSGILGLIGAHQRNENLKLMNQAYSLTNLIQTPPDQLIARGIDPDTAIPHANQELEELFKKKASPDVQQHRGALFGMLHLLTGIAKAPYTVGKSVQEFTHPPMIPHVGQLPADTPTVPPDQIEALRQRYATQAATRTAQAQSTGGQLGRANMVRELQGYTQSAPPSYDEGGEVPGSARQPIFTPEDVRRISGQAGFNTNLSEGPTGRIAHWFTIPGQKQPVKIYESRTGLETVARDPWTPPEGAQEIDPQTMRPMNVPGMVGGADPRLQAYAAATGAKIDPGKSYHIQQDHQGNITGALEGPDQTVALRGNILPFYYELRGKINPATGVKYTDPEARIAAGTKYADLLETQIGVRIDKTRQDMAVTEALSGVPSGGGQRTITPTGTGAGTGAITKPASVPGQAAAPSQRTATFPSGRPLFTPDEERFVSQYLELLAGNTPGSRSAGFQVGALKGKEILRKASGLDPIAFTTSALVSKDQMKTVAEQMQRQVAISRLNETINQMGPNFIERSQQILDTKSPLLNRIWRTVEPAAISDPEYKRYLIALNAISRQYTTLTANGQQSRAMLPVGIQQHIDTFLNPNMTLGEGIAALAQIKQEGVFEENAAKNNVKKTVDEVNAGVLSGKPQGVGTGAGQGAGAGGGPNAPQVALPKPEPGKSALATDAVFQAYWDWAGKEVGTDPKNREARRQKAREAMLNNGWKPAN